MVKQFVTHTIFLTKYLAWGIMHYRLVRRKCYSLYRYSVANLPDLKIFGSQFTYAKQISLHKDIIMIKKCVIHNNKINHLGGCLCKSFLLGRTVYWSAVLKPVRGHMRMSVLVLSLFEILTFLVVLACH